jgi:hypothetical protein
VLIQNMADFGITTLGAVSHCRPRLDRLGVKKPRTTLAASLVALFGETIKVRGAAADDHLFGDFLAFGMTI